MRITVPWFVIVMLAATVSVFTQSPASPSGPTFDVVSIKRHIPEPGPLGFRSTQNERPDGGITMTNIRIMNLIVRAYPGVVVLPIDIEGLPGWATSEGYNVSAT